VFSRDVRDLSSDYPSFVASLASIDRVTHRWELLGVIPVEAADQPPVGGEEDHAEPSVRRSGGIHRDVDVSVRRSGRTGSDEHVRAQNVGCAARETLAYFGAARVLKELQHPVDATGRRDFRWPCLVRVKASESNDVFRGEASVKLVKAIAELVTGTHIPHGDDRIPHRAAGYTSFRTPFPERPFVLAQQDARRSLKPSGSVFSR
jgi:hypothetical protein